MTGRGLRAALMWSSGKDSALALRRAQYEGHEVVRLVTFIDSRTERVRFHGTRRRLLEAQAAAAGIELLAVPIEWSTMGEALAGVLSGLRSEGIEAIVMGNVHLADVREWYESRVRAAGLVHIDPLWGEPPAQLLGEFLDSGGRAVITCVERARLSPQWLGREVSRDLLEESIDPCGENGEYHSFCFLGCGSDRPVPWLAGVRSPDGNFDLLDLVPASCTGCDRDLVDSDHYLCAICPSAVLCQDCAAGHLCTPECSARGCLSGLCVKRVGGGRMAEHFGVGGAPTAPAGSA